MRSTTIRVGVGLLAAALVLTGCGGSDDRAETTTAAEDPDRVAALEAELEKLSGDAADGDGGEGEPSEDGPSGTDEDGQAIEPLVVDVNETKNNDDDTVEIILERLIVHDYHVEVELSATNSHPEAELKLWSELFGPPLLFDEQDRRFEYQHPAGYNRSDYVTLGPGERLEAVVMFGRRLHPDAQQLTLRFQDAFLEDVEWTIALPENGR